MLEDKIKGNRRKISEEEVKDDVIKRDCRFCYWDNEGLKINNSKLNFLYSNFF
jgi:hypothetical protein